MNDLQPDNFPDVTWDNTTAANSLESLRDYVASEVKHASDWYVKKRKLKRRAGRVTRVIAIVAAAIAGVLPVLATVSGGPGQFAVHPAWATVLLAAAALLVSLDYFYGWTSGWVRYLVSQQKITRLAYDFQFNWEIQRAVWWSNKPSAEQVEEALSRLKEHLLTVHQVVEDETAEWAAEFRNTVQKFDEAARTQARTIESPRGAVVQVTSADGLGEWSLTVDDGVPTQHSGSRTGLVSLPPGPHKFVVEGQLDGRVLRDEVAAEVRPSGVTEVSLTLK